MFNYNFDTLNNIFRSLIEKNVDQPTLEWLDEKAALAQMTALLEEVRTAVT